MLTSKNLVLLNHRSKGVKIMAVKPMSPEESDAIAKIIEETKESVNLKIGHLKDCLDNLSLLKELACSLEETSYSEDLNGLISTFNSDLYNLFNNIMCYGKNKIEYINGDFKYTKLSEVLTITSNLLVIVSTILLMCLTAFYEVPIIIKLLLLATTSIYFIVACSVTASINTKVYKYIAINRPKSKGLGYLDALQSTSKLVLYELKSLSVDTSLLDSNLNNLAIATNKLFSD